MTPHDFADAVYTYCVLTGGSESSGFRSRFHNARVHGVEHSPHLARLGRDIVYDEELELWFRAEWARRLGLLLVPEADHDHLQPLDWTAG